MTDLETIRLIQETPFNGVHELIFSNDDLRDWIAAKFEEEYKLLEFDSETHDGYTDEDQAAYFFFSASLIWKIKNNQYDIGKCD